MDEERAKIVTANETARINVIQDELQLLFHMSYSDLPSSPRLRLHEMLLEALDDSKEHTKEEYLAVLRSGNRFTAIVQPLVRTAFCVVSFICSLPS